MHAPSGKSLFTCLRNSTLGIDSTPERTSGFGKSQNCNATLGATTDALFPSSVVSLVSPAIRGAEDGADTRGIAPALSPDYLGTPPSPASAVVHCRFAYDWGQGSPGSGPP